MFHIKTLFAHQDKRQQQSFKSMVSAMGQAAFAFDIVDIVSDTQSAYESILQYAPHLVIMEDSLFTPAINILSAESEVILFTDKRELTDMGNIRFVYNPIQSVYLMKKIFRMYSQLDGNWNANSVREFLDSLPIATSFISQIESYCAQQTIGASLVAQRTKILEAIQNHEIIFEGEVQKPVEVPDSVPDVVKEPSVVSDYEVVQESISPEQKEPPVPTAIMVYSVPKQTKYPFGFEEMDLEGGVINVYYSDNTSELIPMDDSMDFEVNSFEVGTAPVNITFQGLKTSFAITIEEPKLVSLRIKQMPAKTAYFDGDLFVTYGLILEGEYNNGSVKEITEIPQFEHQLRQGEAIVAVSIQGVSVPVPVQVSKKANATLGIKTLPNKATYLEMKEPLDMTGCTLTYTDKDGEVEEVSVSNDMVFGFDNAIVGKKDLIISFKTLSCHVSVEVIAAAIESIKVSQMPDKTTFFVGDTYDFSGIKVIAHYNNDTTKEISDFQLDKTIAILKDTFVVLSYSGKSVSIPVRVLTKGLEGITIAKLPSKVEYLENKEEFLADGGEISLIYNDGSNTVASLLSSMVTGFSNKVPGPLSLTVSYKGHTTEFAVTIKAKELLGITISSAPNKTEYKIGEVFDPEGLGIVAVYDNGEKYQVEDFQCSPKSPLTLQDEVITIQYFNKSVAIPILVTNEVVTPTISDNTVASIPGKEKFCVFYPSSVGLRFDENE